MKTVRTLIVDDEHLARERLARQLQAHTQIHIIAECGSVAESVSKIDELQPDLVFLDVRLGDGDAFDILSGIHHVPHIIFSTAYSDYAYKAFEHKAVDYLLKPVDAKRLADALQRLPDTSSADTKAPLQALLELASSLRHQPKPVSYPVTVGDRTLFVRYDDITHIEAKDKLVYLVTRDKKEYPIDTSLTKLTESLPMQFVQVHRAFIINRDHLSEIHRYFGGKYKLLLGKPMIVTIESGVTYKDIVDGLKQAM
jgi:two-component system, LytTR family, response regulator